MRYKQNNWEQDMLFCKLLLSWKEKGTTLVISGDTPLLTTETLNNLLNITKEKCKCNDLDGTSRKPNRIWTNHP